MGGLEFVFGFGQGCIAFKTHQLPIEPQASGGDLEILLDLVPASCSHQEWGAGGVDAFVPLPGGAVGAPLAVATSRQQGEFGPEAPPHGSQPALSLSNRCHLLCQLGVVANSYLQGHGQAEANPALNPDGFDAAGYGSRRRWPEDGQNACRCSIDWVRCDPLPLGTGGARDRVWQGLIQELLILLEAIQAAQQGG